MVTAACPSAAVLKDARVIAEGLPQAAVDKPAELRSEAIHEMRNRRVTADVEVTALAVFTHA